MRLVCRLLGIQAHDTSARAQKGTAAKAERANAYVRRMERIMTANGQLSATHLLTYLAAIEIAANQQSEWSGHSSHERLFAQRPITVTDLIAPGDFPTINIEEHALLGSMMATNSGLSSSLLERRTFTLGESSMLTREPEMHRLPGILL